MPIKVGDRVRLESLDPMLSNRTGKVIRISGRYYTVELDGTLGKTVEFDPFSLQPIARLLIQPSDF